MGNTVTAIGPHVDVSGVEFRAALDALGMALFTARPEPVYNGEFHRPAGWSAFTHAGNGERLALARPGWAFMGVTGEAVAVVDVDTKNGASVSDVREWLSDIDVTVYAEVVTPSGGRHFYVAGHPDLPTVSARSGRDGLRGLPGVEVSSHGRNVFLPGTVRPNYDGKGYAVLFDDLRALSDLGPWGGEALAAWVADNRCIPATARFNVGEPWSGEPLDARQRAYLAGALTRMGADLAGEGPGGRNTAAYNAGMACGNYIAGAGMDEVQAVEALVDACRTNGLVDDDGERAVVASIRSGIRNGKRNPRAVPPPLLDRDTFGRVGAVTEPVAPTIDHTEPDHNARERFPRLDWSTFWDATESEEWVHYPLIPARRGVSIYSAPKVGKSLLALELAAGLATGREVLGYTPERCYRVLYVDHENDPHGDIRPRLRAMGYGPDDNLEPLSYLTFPPMAGLDTERGAAELLSTVATYGAEVVIIDTVSRVVVGEENSNDTWLGLYRHTGAALKRAGVAVVRLDHSGKDEAKGTRGGSAKSGDVDLIWRLAKDAEDRMRFECTDSRLPMPVKRLDITRETIPHLRHTVAGIATQSTREQQVVAIVEQADGLALADDASREVLKARGISGRNDVIAEAVKRRKARPRSTLDLSPNVGDSHRESTGPTATTAPGTTGTAEDDPRVTERQKLSPTIGDSRGQPPPPHLSPGQQSLAAPVGTAQQNGGPPPVKTSTCKVCEEPMTVVEDGQTTHPTCSERQGPT